MSLATAFFAIAVLVTATVAAPILLGVLARRQSRRARWLWAHVRWLWAVVAFLWLVSLALELAQGSSFPELHLIVSSLGFVSAVATAFLHRPGGHEFKNRV